MPGTQERTLNSGESSVWCCGVCAPGVEVAWCAAGRRGETSLFFNSKLHNPVLRRSGKPPLLLDSHACALPVSTPPVSHTHTSPQPHTPALSPALLPYVKALHTHTNAKYTHSREHAQLSSLSLSLSPPQHTHTSCCTPYYAISNCSQPYQSLLVDRPQPARIIRRRATITASRAPRRQRDLRRRHRQRHRPNRLPQHLYRLDIA